MLGTGQQHWSTVHVADLADFFRRVLDDDSARGRYVIGNGLKPTVAELTQAAAVAVGAPGAEPGSDDEARAHLGDSFAEVLLLDQGTAAARARAELGWHPSHPSLVDEFEGGDVLDAAVLLMPLVKFISPTDPKWLSTLDALTARLVSDSLVYRYDPQESPDGVRGAEGTFSACSFWYVEALTRAGRLEEARLAFEKMLTYANHLGLYAEQISRTGEQQGNFPQALTHLALISAAFNLDRALG
jgi:hypothetical protein